VARPHLEVADVLNQHGDAFIARHRGHLSLGQLKVMAAIRACRTAALGGHKGRAPTIPHPSGRSGTSTLAPIRPALYLRPHFDRHFIANGPLNHSMIPSATGIDRGPLARISHRELVHRGSE
jgi:hypothetical protein